MKKNYFAPELSELVFSEDILTTSDFDNVGNDIADPTDSSNPDKENSEYSELPVSD